MSRVTELEKALTTLFRKGTEVGYTETEIDEFLENIDYHALLQAVWNKAETVYAYRADGKNALSLDYRSAELFKQRATLLYEDVGDSYIGAVFAARSMELWLLEDMGFAVVAKFSVNAGEGEYVTEYRVYKGSDWADSEISLDLEDLVAELAALCDPYYEHEQEGGTPLGAGKAATLQVAHSGGCGGQDKAEGAGTMKQLNVKKLILPNIPYVFIALLATKVSEAVRLAPGSDASAKLLNIMTGLNTAFHSLVPSFHPIDLCVGVAAAIAIRLAVYIKGKNAKKFRKNLEYGSARWGTAEDIKSYVDPAFENNIILTQTERLTMNSRPKDPKTARNKNVLIVGGSGSGKTRFWLKPNLLQCTSKTYPTSFVVTDPKGDIVVSCGHALQKNGWRASTSGAISSAGTS